MSKIWKWLFLGLLALNLALVSVVAYRIMTPVETTSSVSLPKGATKIGKYSMTREELDAALTGFAQDYSTDKMRFKVNRHIATQFVSNFPKLVTEFLL